MLGIDEEATADQIKKAFRALSLKYHPDKNPGEIEKFKSVSQAYEVLSNEELKFVYDFGGMAGLKKHDEKKKGQGMDPFAQFFGGGRQEETKGPNANVEFQVTLEQLYKDGQERARIARRVVCRGCDDDAIKTKPKDRCKLCGRCPNEVRMVHRQMGNGFIVQQQEQVTSKYRCKNEDKDLDLTIERGAAPDTQITFPFASEQKPGQVPGDVIVVLKQQKHSLFERKESHLHMTMKISLKEALLGFSKSITHLDGHVVPIAVAPGQVVKPFQVMVIQGEGMPVHEVPSQFGDLHVTFELVFPRTVTAEQREALEKIL